MVTLAIVGDIFMTAPLPEVVISGAAIRSLQQADIAFGNLEAPVSTRGTPVEKWINMRMSPELVADLKAAGLDVLTLANNHMMDYGLDAFFDTLQYLTDGTLSYIGVGNDVEEAWQPIIIKIAGQRIAFIAGCSTLGPQLAAGEHRPGVAPVHVREAYHVDGTLSMEQPGSAPYVHTTAWAEDVERAQQAVRDARTQADFVIVAMHWGVPPFWRSRFQDGLADYQVQVGHALVDAGANLIVGHHPHSLQAVEVYQGVPIFYSLGNFIFHDHSRGQSPSSIVRNIPYKVVNRRNRIWSESVILNVNLSDSGEVAYTMYPILLDKTGNPCSLPADEAQALIERLAEMSPDAEISFEEGRGNLVL